MMNENSFEIVSLPLDLPPAPTIPPPPPDPTILLPPPAPTILPPPPPPSFVNDFNRILNENSINVVPLPIVQETKSI